jgi:molybdopterin biosynthesis enzyme
MLSVEQARDLILAEARCLPTERIPLLGALGRVLAEDVVSDIDSPPHDKSTVDGYAVVARCRCPRASRAGGNHCRTRPTKTVEPGTPRES